MTGKRNKQQSSKPTQPVDSNQLNQPAKDVTIEVKDTPLTKSDLQEAFEEVINKHLNPTIEQLQASLDAVSQVANNALKLVEKQAKEIVSLKEEIDKLKNVPSNISQLEERIEERTNRQLRKTLVFRGIPEKADETWEDTKNLLAKSIQKTLQINENETSVDMDDALAMVERAHRSAPNPHYKGNAPRPIFAAMSWWPDCETIIETYRKKNMSDSSHTTSVDYKYGPMTTKRRSLAFKERKRLKDAGEIVSGYVAYPARLMVKTSKVKGTKYVCHKDFSKEKPW